MDDSIINFHQQKMEDINEILKDLWTRVYQGNDIETIKIRFSNKIWLNSEFIVQKLIFYFWYLIIIILLINNFKKCINN